MADRFTLPIGIPIPKGFRIRQRQRQRQSQRNATDLTLVATGTSEVVGDLAAVPLPELRARLAVIDATLHLAAVQRAHLARLEWQRQLVDERIAALRGEGRVAA